MDNEAVKITKSSNNIAPSDQLAELNPKFGVISGLIYDFREIFSKRQLLFRLTRRDIKSKYKNSSLGFFWSLAKPLALMLIYFIAIGKFLGASRSIPDFVIFMFSGFAIWGLFSETISSSTSSIISNSGLVKKVHLPRELFPLAAFLGSGFNFLIQLGLLLAVIALMGVFPFSANLLFVPAAVALITIFSLSLGLLFSALNVYMRDIQHLIEIALLILFWASPIVYSFSFVHSALNNALLENIYLANPVTLGVIAMQKGLWEAGTLSPAQIWPDHLELRMLVAIVFSLLLLVFSQRVFSRLEGNFAQEL